jgi:uncharacterized protein
MVEQLGDYELFKGRDFNAHMPTLDAYRRMLPVFDTILHQVSNKDFTAAQIVEVLDAYKHPEHRDKKISREP